MAVIKKLKRALRGEVKLSTAAREALRRSRAAAQSRRERASLNNPPQLALTASFSRLTPDQLLTHFKQRTQIFSLSGFDSCSKDLTTAIPTDWRRDPRSGYVWPLDYHRDLMLLRSDGSDVRVVWELNRLGHLLRLGCAYSQTNDERLTAEFVAQLKSWHEQNPYGRGPNWACAMEVALRAINLLAAFELFRKSPQFDADALLFFLRLLQQHGKYIHQNLEFSYIATSNHYLSDVAGLLWLGVMLPELRDAVSWREFGLTQLLAEMDKQILADGADYESSTGYHRFVLELFLYSFMLCRSNKVEIPERYWQKLRDMLLYVRAYLRPDGFAPLIGDTDGGQVLPVQQRRADDHGYLLKIGAEVFNDPSLATAEQTSKAFPDAAIYIMRKGDCYLCFNASDAGINGRGSHGHNDALGIEVSAGGCAFIVDPGTYVYTADLQKRHAFRSTAYHSTVRINQREQNTTEPDTPFVIGNEARPRVLEWKTTDDFDRVVAEHYGYGRLRASITHRRTVTFNKAECSWLIDDEFVGPPGEHNFEIWFHFAAGLELSVVAGQVEARDRSSHARLVVRSLTLDAAPALEPQHVSRDYGEIRDSVSACWCVSGQPQKLSWQIQPRNN